MRCWRCWQDLIQNFSGRRASSVVLASWQERRAVKSLRERCPDLPRSVSGVMAMLIALFGVLALIGALLR